MFTGLIEEIGTIISIRRNKSSFRLTIEADVILKDIKIGDSIAVNGICLTAENTTSNSFTADVMPETVLRTSLNNLKSSDKVNLERAMASNGRFGGHIVSGHIDGVGTIVNKKEDENAIWITISADKNIIKYVVEKGSISIDGISLTVAYVDTECFKVSIIPHTMKMTTLYFNKVGEKVNLECDIIGKYVERFLYLGDTTLNSNYSSTRNDGLNNFCINTASNIDIDFLTKNGF